MNIVAVIAGLVQASTWTVAPPTVTVGDTVYVTKRLVTEGAAQARVQPLSPGGAIEALTDPLVSYSEGTVLVRYALAFFASGRQGTRTPDIELVYPDGRLVRVPGDTVWVSVASVLPPDDSLPPPRPAIAPMGRSVTRADPIVLLVVTTFVAVLAWGFVRRRPKTRPSWPVDAATTAMVPFERWLSAGEPRAVAAAVAGHLRGAIEQTDRSVGRQLSTDECVRQVVDLHSDWPVEEFGETLAALDRARFAPADATDLVALTERADRLVTWLHQSGTTKP